MIASEVLQYLMHKNINDGSSQNTLSAYRNDLSQFEEYLEDESIQSVLEITPDDLNEYIQMLIEKGYAGSSIARKIHAIKGFLLFFEVNFRVFDFTTERLEAITVKPENRTISGEVFDSIVDCCVREDGPAARRDLAILEILWDTGMNSSECVALNRSSVEVVERQKVGLSYQVRNQKQIEVELSLNASLAVSEYLNEGYDFYFKEGHSDSALFSRKNSFRITREGVWVIVRGRGEDAGLFDLSPRILRNSYIHNTQFENARRKRIKEF